MTQRAYPSIVPGTYRLLHGGDYNPEQWLHQPEILAEDPRLMRLAGINAASVGIFAWAAIEPEPGRFELAWLDAVLDRLQAAGVGVILATPTAARPRWLAEAHPEVMPLRRNGQREAPGNNRHNFCRSSAVYRERSALVIGTLAERYARHPALLGWHINNEYAGAEDNDRCYCPGCLAAFRTWLRRRYGDDLDALNRAWWTGFWSHTYTSWEQIRPGDAAVEALALNWHRFTSAQLVEFCAFEISCVRRHSQAPVTTNWHGGLAGFDHGAMAPLLDFASYDAYPDIDGSARDRDSLHLAAWQADTVRGLSGGRPWLLMESCPGQPQYKAVLRAKRPGVHRLLSLSEVAHGSDGACYFQWRAGRGGMEKLHGAVVMQDAPYDTRIFREVAALGQELAALSAVAGAAIPAVTAVVWDIASTWARDANSGLQSLPKPAQRSQTWHRLLWERGIGVDIVDGTRDLSGYRLIVVPGVFLLRPGLVEHLRAAAAAGAQIVVDALSAWVDDDLACVAGGRPGPLRGDLGLRSEEFDQCRPDERQLVSATESWLPEGAQVGGWLDHVLPEDCTVLARAVGGFHDGWPVLTRKAQGAGAFWYLAGEPDAPAYAHLIGRLAAAAGVESCLPGLPAGVIARERRQPGRRFIFLANPGEVAQAVRLPDARWNCAVSGAALGASLDLAAWDLRIITTALA